MTALNTVLDAADRALLNLLQRDFPLVSEPFQLLAAEMGSTQAGVLGRVRSLCQGGFIRSIGGVFDPEGLGYRSTLAALHVADERLDEAARVVNAHPGVSHNYARDHYFNLWFTLSLPAEEDADSVIAMLALQTGAEASANLPALRVFKLRVYFDMVGEDEPDGGQVATDAAVKTKRVRLSLEDRKVVALLCHDIPLVERPFDVLARRAGLRADDFIVRMKRLREQGVMRRLAAVLRHQRAGFVANAMSCWRVPPELVETVCSAAGARKEVSHCYERKTAPGWPYNVFAMVHGRNAGECQAVAEAVSRQAGVADFVLLRSTKEYKKEKVKYFEWLV
ncbi:MAG: Lrp/AsnC family transcriptional regulator [Chloroflexota bacterium]